MQLVNLVNMAHAQYDSRGQDEAGVCLVWPVQARRLVVVNIISVCFCCNQCSSFYLLLNDGYDYEVEIGQRILVEWGKGLPGLASMQERCYRLRNAESQLQVLYNNHIDRKWVNEYFLWYYLTQQPSVLSHCWLGGRKGIWSVKKLEWRGTGVVVCLEQGTDLHMAQLMPLPLTISCFSKIQIGFTFLVPAHLGSPGQRAAKRLCVCVCTISPRSWIKSH